MSAAPARFRNWAVSAALLARDLGHIARSRKSETGPSLNRQFAWMADPSLFAYETVGITLDPWQLLPIRGKHRKWLGNLSRQSGKALHVDTPIPTPSGWTTMGDIKVGDTVFDASGRPCAVLQVSPVTVRDVYRVRFSDGTEIIADGEHLWTVLGKGARAALIRAGEGVPEEWWSWDSCQVTIHPDRQCEFTGCEKPRASHGLCASHRAQERKGKVLAPLDSRRGGRRAPVASEMLTTIDLSESVGKVRTHTGGRTSRESEHAIPIHPGLQLPGKDFMQCDIDPYTLGAWLGDGTSASGQITSADAEIIQEIRDAGYRVDYCEAASKGTGKADVYVIRGLHRSLRLHGLLKNKHIPKEYLRADHATRLALLQGLMDTDGFVGTENRSSVCELTTTREQLANDAYELAVSLGLSVRVTKGRAMLRGKDCGPKWRLFFTPHIQVFRLPRKVQRLTLDKRPTQRRLRFVTSVERLPSPVPVRCIGIDSESHLYLAGRGMIPTHNTTAASLAIAYTALFQPWRRRGDVGPADEHPILVTAPSMRQTKILVRAARNIIRGSRMVNELVANNVMELELPNGSRIVGVAAREDTIRGHQAPPLVVIDEASRVPDEVWDAITPMMATVSETVRVFAPSTPHGERGWWWEAYENGGDEWGRIQRTAHECPRITKEFLESERRRMPPNKFAEEYETLFAPAESQPFPPHLLDRIFQSPDGITPIAVPGRSPAMAEKEAHEDVPTRQDTPDPNAPGWLQEFDWENLT